jgi:hypothetical protein
MFLMYTFWALLWVLLPLGRDNTLREAGWPLMALGWVTAPLLGGVATRYVVRRLARPPESLQLTLTLAQWALLAFNLTATAFALLIFQTIATPTDFHKLSGPMVLAVIVVNAGWLWAWQHRPSKHPHDPLYVMVGSGLLLLLGTILGARLPIDLYTRLGDSTISITAPEGRILSACHPLEWNLTNVEDVRFSQQSRHTFDTLNNTSVNVCAPFDPAAPVNESIYEFRVTLPDGTTTIQSIFFSSMYRSDWLKVGLAGLLMLFVPTFALHNRILWPLVLMMVWAAVDFLPETQLSFAWLWAIVLTWMLGGVLPQLDRWAAQAPLRRVVDILLLLLIPLLTINVALPGNRTGLNVWLAPINDLLQGKTLFVDSASTVGIGSVAAFSVLFQVIPLNGPTFTLAGYILFALTIGVLFILLRRLTAQITAPILFLVTTVALFVWQDGGGRTTPFQTGDILQTGFQYVLVLWVGLRYTNRANRRTWRILEIVTVGAACIWSVPAAGLTFIPYLFLLLYELSVSWEPWHVRLRRLATHLVAIGGVIAVGFAIYWFAAIASTGTPPDLIILWAYIARPAALIRDPAVFSPWGFAILLYTLILSWVTLRQPEDIDTYAVPVLMAVVGIVQITYWTRFQLDSYTLPAIWLAAYVFGQLGTPYTPTLLRRAGHSALLFGFSWILIWHIGQPTSTTPVRVPLQWIWTGYENPLATDVVSPVILEAADLIDTYTPDAERIALFMEPNASIDVLTYTEKTHIWRLTNPFIDQQIPGASDWIRAYEGYTPEIGDILYVQRDNAGMNFLQVNVLNQLTSGYEIETLDTTESGLQARRIVGLEADDEDED